jgi:hypothetical protein
MSARKGGTGRSIRLWDLDAAPGSTAETLLKTYLGALAGVDKLDAKKAELANSAEFTPVGIQKGAVDYAFREIVPQFQKGRLAIQRAKQEVAARRAKLVPPAVDKTDAAGALRRQEVRALVRGMDNKSRDNFLKQNGGFTGLDPEIRAALIEMPASMSGISESFRGELLNQAMQSAYGPELDQIAELERAIEITASAVGESSEAIRHEAVAADPTNADPDVYAARATQAAGAADALWLKKFDEGGVEVVRAAKWNEDGKTGSWAKATEAEISSGLYAESREEFDRLKSAAPIFGAGEEGRTARAAFVDEHGLDAYLARNKIERST